MSLSAVQPVMTSRKKTFDGLLSIYGSLCLLPGMMSMSSSVAFEVSCHAAYS